MRRAAIISLLLFTAVSEPGWAADSVSTTAARLEAQVGAGGPVAILPSDAGLTASNLDGTVTEVLVPGVVSWVLVDNITSTVWFFREGPRKEGAKPARDLLALDLRSAETKAVVIIASMPSDSGDAAPETVGIRTPHGYLSVDSPQSSRVDIHVDGKPKLVADARLQATWLDDVGAWERKVLRKVRLTAAGKKLLVQLSRRAKAHAPPSPPQEPARVRVPTDACEDPKNCGVARALDGTPYWLVTTSWGCGDGCYSTEQLFDPRTKRFLNLREHMATSAAPFADGAFPLPGSVSPNGEAYISSGAIYRFDRGPIRAALPANTPRGGGWIGGWDVSE